MDFQFSPAERAYRDEVRAWLAANVPAWWRDSSRREFADVEGQHERIREWHQTLYDAGYVGVTWPEAYGGAARSHVENALLQEELARVEAPPTTNGLGIGLCGPAIMHHGTEAQKRRFLQPMLRAEEMWCQGYSEPGAGSDLANVQTRAERHGDVYRVNGQKVWTSSGHLADWCFALVRTDPAAAKHDGIGFLLIDMRSPGIEVAPIVQITGNQNFSEVFFRDVDVPVANLVGAATEGWKVANTVLSYERGASTLSRYALYKRQFDELVALAKKTRDRGGGLRSAEPLTRQKVAQLAIDVEVLRLSSLRQLTALARGETPGPESSIQKLYYSELDQRLARAGNSLAGPHGQLLRGRGAIEDARWSLRELQSRAVTIYAGSSEIQRNIISERVLGLPRR